MGRKFNRATNPGMTGVFEVATGDNNGPWYSVWNGARWGSIEASIEDAEKNSGNQYKELPWREIQKQKEQTHV